MNPREEIAHLTEVLERANHQYYVLDAPEMEDYEYDRLLRRLEELGFRAYLEAEVQGPIITTFFYPEGAEFTFREMYQYIKERGYVLYPGKVMEAETFRVGNIGEIYPEDIERLAAIMAEFLREVRG